MSWWTQNRGKVLGAVATVAGAYFGYPALGAMVGKMAAGSDTPEATPAQPYGPTDDGGNLSSTTQLPTVTTSASPSGTNWGSVIGALGTGAANIYGQTSANSANAAQARAQQEFQASQTGTSYQRGVADMKAAGLNPMLAYSQGGASSGSGAQATMGNAIAPGTSSAFQGLQTLAGLGLTKAQIENTNAQTDFTASQTAMQDIRTAQIVQDTQTSASSAGQIQAATKKIHEETPGAGADSRYKLGSLADRLATTAAESRSASIDAQLKGLGVNKASAESSFWGSAAGKASPYLNLAGETANSAASVFHKLKPWSIR
jgi:hypothetical protein